MKTKPSRPQKSAAPGQTCILVLGMHRSGTSVMTRVINLHGVALGQDLLGVAPDNNNKGFWEKRAVMEMHERLLAGLHRSWHDPRPLPKGWLTSEAATSAADEISEILDEFENDPVFAIKDPRTSQFVDLWIPALRQRKIRPVIVYVIRHPGEVAQSLRRRDGWPNELSWLLWHRSLTDMLASTKLLPRCVVSYQGLLDDWQATMNGIRDKLGVSWPLSGGQVADEVMEFIDTGERHNHYVKTARKHKVPPHLLKIYTASLGLETGAPWRSIEAVIESRADFDTATVPLHEDLSPALVPQVSMTEVSAMKRELEELSGQLLKQDELVKDLTGQVLGRDQKIESLAGQVDTLMVVRDTLIVVKDALTASEKESVFRQRERKELTATIAESKQQLLELGEALAHSNASLLALQKKSKKDADQMAAEQQRQLARLADAFLEQAKLRTTISEMEVKYAEASRQNDVLSSTLKDIFQSLTWKMTAPLRTVGPVTRGLLSRLRRPRSQRSGPGPSQGDEAAGTSSKEASGLENTNHETVSKKILLVSYYCPTRAHAGGLRILDIYTYLKDANPSLQLDLYTHYRPEIDGSNDDCEAIFDKVYLAPNESLTAEGLRALGCNESQYDIIDLQFHDAGRGIDGFRKLGRKLIFTPMESALRVFLISLRKSYRNLGKSTMDRLRCEFGTARSEIRFCRKVDEVVCVSQNDAKTLRLVSGTTKVTGLETGVSMVEFGDALDRKPRKSDTPTDPLRVLYVAYFGSQTNVDALKWYLDHVHTIVKQRVPGYLLTVVGRGDMSIFSSYSDDSIEFVGEVPRLGPYIEQATIGIAPALSGSGFRGKVNQYALFQVPSVVTPISLKGLNYKKGKDIFVARSAGGFARACVKLLLKPDVRNRISKAAYERCMREYTWKSRDGQLSDVYKVRKNMAKGERLVSALVPSYNHGGYLKQRIESILGQTHKNIELIVIDDSSQDGSDQVIRELLQDSDFRYIRNKVNSGTPFSAWGKAAEIARGDFIWICESDDFAEPEFLENAVRAMTADESASIYYSNSWVVDETGKRVGDTNQYFTDTWKESRWSCAFTSDGKSELINFQQRGQVVPNMSSALIEAGAFRESYSPFLKRFKLTGDWLFVGWLMNHGRVIFDPQHLSNFRKHQVTARASVQSARSQAEFILTKYLLFKGSGRRLRELSSVLTIDAVRFAYEPARWYQVVFAMLQVSLTKSVKCGFALAVSVTMKPGLVGELRERLAHAKGLTK